MKNTSRLTYEIVRDIKGKELVGIELRAIVGVDRGENAHKVWHADYVEHRSWYWYRSSCTNLW